MATEKRLIDANVFAEHLERMTRTAYPNLFPGLLEAIDYAKDFPTVDAAEVVHSFWDDSGRYVFPSGRKAICCDICKCALSVGEYNRFKWNYCPVCGAKMDAERSTDETN